MNHDDYSLAGFAYGSANSPVKYDWSSFYVNVLCAHNHLKSVGYTLTCILKLMAIEVHKKTRAKTRLTKRIKKTKKNKFNDSKNYWNVLRNSSSLSSSSSKQKTK